MTRLAVVAIAARATLPSLRHAHKPSAASCAEHASLPMQNCAAFVRSRESMQLVLRVRDESARTTSTSVSAHTVTLLFSSSSSSSLFFPKPLSLLSVLGLHSPNYAAL